MVNQIPGVQVQQIASIDNWASTPEPNYLIPDDVKAMTVFIDGSDLKKPDTETLTLIGQGFYTEVSDLKLTPGQSDGVYFTGDGKGFVYRTAPGHDQSPTVASAIAVGDNAYAFAAKAIGVKGGSQLTMYIDPKLNAFVLDTTGTTPVKSQQGYAAYVLSVVKAVAERRDHLGEREEGDPAAAEVAGDHRLRTPSRREQEGPGLHRRVTARALAGDGPVPPARVTLRG